VEFTLAKPDSVAGAAGHAPLARQMLYPVAAGSREGFHPKDTECGPGVGAAWAKDAPASASIATNKIAKYLIFIFPLVN
jgi:hypothetical protein